METASRKRSVARQAYMCLYLYLVAQEDHIKTWGGTKMEVPYGRIPAYVCNQVGIKTEISTASMTS
jgi:hypothetical protein